ncbi:MAG: cell wall hydrolase [Herbinix sp.]|nr:cell wall hydrolase [Herbinix sp.]
MIGLKKTKLSLISMIVFITVFSLTAIFDIPIHFYSTKDNLTNTNEVITTESNTLADDKQEGRIQSFSVEINQNTDTDVQSQALDNQLDNTQPNISVIETEPKAKYANIGISVAKDYVNIRKKASTDSDVLGKLYKGSAAEIIKTKGDWYYVESGSVKGYVSSEFIKTGIPDEELAEKYGTLSISVEVDGLNVRKEASTDSKKVTVIYQNETYPVVKTKGDWIEIKIPDDNVNGYVKSEFAELLVEFKDAVSKEEEQKLLQLEAEERAKKETEVQYQDGVNYSGSDLQLLTCLVHAEAGTQSYECKLAVANIVLNRVASSKYADTIKAVIYQSGQFSVAASGSLQKQLDKYNNYSSRSQLLSIKAAKDALAGANNIGSRLYFHSYSAAVKKGYDSKSTSVKLGGLLFW